MLAECAAGFVVGLVARYFVPDSQGAGSDTLIGIMGAGMGSFIYKRFGHSLSFDDFNLWSIATAAVAALLLIIFSRMMAGRRTIAP